MSLKNLTDKLYPIFIKNFSTDSDCKIFLSASDMKTRAIVQNAKENSPADAWNVALEKLKKILDEKKIEPKILRADWVTSSEKMTWENFNKLIEKTRRNYFRRGISLDSDYKIAFTETEMNANYMLYKDGKEGSKNCVFRQNYFDDYCEKRFGCKFPKPEQNQTVEIFETCGAFIQEGEEPKIITGKDIYAGRRDVSTIDQETFMSLAKSGANYLARQVQKNGRFIYGHYPCFDRIVPSYNSLRHFSSTFAMLDVYGSYKKMPPMKLGKAIVNSLNYAVKNFIVHRKLDDGTDAAYVNDLGETKLGANGVTLLALVKYTELMHTKKFLPLMNSLANGILSMQNPDGSFVHVLNTENFSVKEPFRIVYYDGEAVFGMMRLYSITKDERLLKASELAFQRFIATNHWQNHDHWLSYAVNELTLYQPDEKYFEFGINNFLSFLPFIYHRDTQFPTLMELMMAADTMLERMKKMPEMAKLLERVNLNDFYAAMEKRAENLLNGFFWPELAMFFANPESIAGSFFIRHHAFRVRIDDVEHFLSGFVAYCRYLERRKNLPAPVPSQELLNGTAEGTGLFNIQSTEKNSTPVETPKIEKVVEEKISEVKPPEKNSTPAETHKIEKIAEENAVIFYGGDVNLGRRMHFKVKEVEQFVGIDEMAAADLRIVNLECVIATKGAQGIKKGEGGPYYFRARPEQVSILTKAGVDIVLTANNHAGDYGAEALLEEQTYLDAAGILHAGSGKNFAAAIKPVCKKIKNLTVAIFSADATMKYFASDIDNPGTAFLPLSQPKLWERIFKDKIQEAHTKADVVIVAPHWGKNEVNEPSEEMKNIGRLLIDLGADAVFGCHSHMIQGVENYKERPIIYDAGDFLFDSKLKPKSGGCFTVEISASGVSKVNFIPLIVGYGQTVRVEGKEAAEINQNFIELCKAFSTNTTFDNSGKVEIKFNPPARRKVTSDVEVQPVETAQNLPLKEWTADKVPDDAIISPQKLGPINLIGCKVSPLEMDKREMLYVETYWTVDKPTDKNCRINIVGVPQRLCFMPKFGLGMEHEGCDWMWPTNLWKPGIIYYERFGLRPPDLRKMINCDIRVEIKVQADSETFGPYVDKNLSKLRLPDRPYYTHDFPESVYHSEPGKTWTAQQLADATGGKWIVEPPKDFYVNSVVRGAKHIDMLNPPTLYVASQGERLSFHEGTSGKTRGDTHLNLPGLEGRIAAAMVSYKVENISVPQLMVEDPIKALIELGFAARKRFHGKVIAVTGTVGKSSVVGMLKQALRHKKCIASYDNYNSRVGVPIILSSLPQDYDYAIIEAAQSGLWMIRGPITVDINPDVSIITQIGLSQTNNKALKTIKDAANFKTRIFMGLTEHGTAIYHDQLECFDYVTERAKKFSERQIVCGKSDKATSKILEIKDTETGHDVRALIEGEEVNFSVSPHGYASVLNMMLVLGAVKAVGENLSVAIENLKDYKPLGSRLEHFDINWENKNIRLIDDSWNATVLSFKRALEVAPFMKTDGRLIGVLGRIVNLGDMAEQMHKSLKDDVLNANFSLIITHGDEMKYLREVLPPEKLGPHFSDAPALINYLRTVVKENDTVLLKGSRRDSDFGTIGASIIEEVKNK